MLDLLQKFARFSMNQRTSDIGLCIGKILQSFLQIPDQAVTLVSNEYIEVLSLVIRGENEASLVQALKVAVMLSTIQVKRSRAALGLLRPLNRYCC